MTHPSRRTLVVCLLAALAASSAVAQSPAAPVRLRATIEKVEGNTITVKDRSGEVVTLAVAANVNISEVVPIALTDIKAGSYVGSGAMPQADGTLRAVEVLVFPEAMRGTGEGHRAWDLVPQSTMTNATVDEVVAGGDANSRTLKLKYKDGEKTLVVPPGAPVVTFKPGDTSLLVVGAKLIVTAELRDGKPTATRIAAGRNGFQPPM